MHCLFVYDLRVTVQEQSSPNFTLALMKNWLICQGHWVKRSRSGSDDHQNLVNFIDGEPLNGFGPKLTQILTALGGQRDYIFNVVGQRSRFTWLNFS